MLCVDNRFLIYYVQWDHSFHLYRIADGYEAPKYDHMTMGSKVRAKRISETCRWTSTICSPCFNSSQSVTQIDTDQIFTEPGWYASFAKLSREAVVKLWDALQLPFGVENTEIEHAFIANLDKHMITAAIHANPLTSSMAATVCDDYCHYHDDGDPHFIAVIRWLDLRHGSSSIRTRM